jgi:molecular chaperone GrpE
VQVCRAAEYTGIVTGQASAHDLTPQHSDVLGKNIVCGKDEMTRKMKPEDETHGRTELTATQEPPVRNAGAAGTDQAGNTNADQTAVSDGGTEALTKLETDNAELKDRLLRALAEVENVRRRAKRDLNDMRHYAIAKFAGDMLNVADNLERAIASIPAKARESEGAVKTLIQGVELTEKEMLRTLERHGVKKLNPMGERFDPNFHEAMFEVPDPSVPNGTVTKVVEAGYSIGSRALRPAKVGVASGGGENRPTPAEGRPGGRK